MPLDLLAASGGEAYLFGLGDIGSKIASFLITGVLRLVNLILTGAVLGLIKLLEPLLTENLAVTDRVYFTDGDWAPHVVEGISGPDGVVTKFNGISMSLMAGFVSLGISISGVMLLLGYLPEVRASAIENLKRIGPFLVLAIGNLFIFETLIEIGTVVSKAAFTGISGDDLLQAGKNALFDGGFLDVYGLTMGLFVAIVALFAITIELCVRLGLMLFIPALGPLVLLSLAFNWSRGFGMKCMKLFIGGLLFQALAAMGIQMMIEVLINSSSLDPDGAFTIPGWAIVCGFCAMVAILPKMLSGAGDAIGAAAQKMKAPAAAGAMVAAGVATGGTAAVGKLAAGGAAKAASGVGGAMGGSGGGGPAITAGGQPAGLLGPGNQRFSSKLNSAPSGGGRGGGPGGAPGRASASTGGSGGDSGGSGQASEFASRSGGDSGGDAPSGGSSSRSGDSSPGGASAEGAGGGPKKGFLERVGEYGSGEKREGMDWGKGEAGAKGRAKRFASDVARAMPGGGKGPSLTGQGFKMMGRAAAHESGFGGISSIPGDDAKLPPLDREKYNEKMAVREARELGQKPGGDSGPRQGQREGGRGGSRRQQHEPQGQGGSGRGGGQGDGAQHEHQDHDSGPADSGGSGGGAPPRQSAPPGGGGSGSSGPGSAGGSPGAGGSGGGSAPPPGSNGSGGPRMSQDPGQAAKTQASYDTLGAKPNASDWEVKSAYREASKKAHPDRGGNPEDFRKVQDAYQHLQTERPNLDQARPPPGGQGQQNGRDQGQANGQGQHQNGHARQEHANGHANGQANGQTHAQRPPVTPPSAPAPPAAPTAAAANVQQQAASSDSHAANQAAVAQDTATRAENLATEANTKADEALGRNQRRP